MSEFMRVFEAKALAEALTEAGHSVSERTAQRWKKGETRPKPQDIRAIRELVWLMLPDTQKNAPPPTGDGALPLERWASSEPPKWAVELTNQIIDAVKDLRGEALEEAARQEVRAAGQELRRQIRAELARGAEGSGRSAPGGRAKRSPRSSG